MSISSSVISLSLEANTWLAPCRIIFNTSSFPSFWAASTSRPVRDLTITTSVRSQNLVTLIFTKTTFCQRGNTKRMAHILSNPHSSRPIRTPLNHQSCFKISYLWKIPLFWCSFNRDTRFCHEKDDHNVVTGWFFTKKWSKWRNSSETLHNDCEIFIVGSKQQWIWMLLNIILSNFQPYRTLLAKVIHFVVSPEKCKNQR